MSKVIHIEICESYNGDKFNVKIGDIVGSSELSNATKMEVLEEVSDAIDEMFPQPSVSELNAGEECEECGKTKWAHLMSDPTACNQFSKKSKSEINHSPQPSVSGVKEHEAESKMEHLDSSEDTSKSKESQIADEINKDYASTKQEVTEK